MTLISVEAPEQGLTPPLCFPAEPVNELSPSLTPVVRCCGSSMQRELPILRWLLTAEIINFEELL